MDIEDFEGCCKACIIRSFGNGHLHEADELNGGRYADERASAAEITEYLNKEVPRLKLRGIHVIFACITNHQPEAFQALTDYGFYTAPEEDLKASDRTYKTYMQDKFGTYIPDETVVIDHRIIPMFYLIPSDGKVIDAT